MSNTFYVLVILTVLVSVSMLVDAFASHKRIVALCEVSYARLKPLRTVQEHLYLTGKTENGDNIGNIILEYKAVLDKECAWRYDVNTTK